VGKEHPTWLLKIAKSPHRQAHESSIVTTTRGKKSSSTVEWFRGNLEGKRLERFA